MKMIYQNRDIDYEDFENEDGETDFDMIYELLNEEFDNLFDRDYHNNRYVVQGIIGRWDGDYSGYKDRVYDSVYDAIIDNMEDYIEVFEEKYGSLRINCYHHDGVNRLEIKEVTKKGEDLLNNWFDGNLCTKKGATRNVRFIKNYL